MRSVLDRFRLSGRAALVTGGGRGLGLQIARALAEAGASVALASRKVERCEEAAAALRAATGANAVAFGADVASEADVQRLVASASDALGDVSILVNAAGASWGAPATALPVSAWDKVMNVNARGTFLASRELARRWIEEGRRGAVLNVASVAGLVGSPPGILDAAGYAASKGAVVALTRDLAAKWAPHGIRVNAVAPGFFPTDMTRVVLERSGPEIVRAVPLGRLGGEEDLGGAALFLVSDASGYVTGQTLAVDGGMTAI